MRLIIRSVIVPTSMSIMMMLAIACLRVHLPSAPMPPESPRLLLNGFSDGPPRNAGTEFRTLSFSPDGSRLATSGNGVIRIWDIRSAKVLFELKCLGPQCRMAFSPDGKLLASTYGGLIGLFDGETGASLRPFFASGGDAIVSIAWSPMGDSLATGHWNGEIILWRAPILEKIATLANQDSADERSRKVIAIRYVSDMVIAAASDDRKIRLWEVPSGRPLDTIAFNDEITDICVRPGTHQLAVATRLVASFFPTVEAYVVLLDVKTRKRQDLGLIAQELSPIACSPDGSKMAFTVGIHRGVRGTEISRTIRVYSIEQKRFVRTFSAEDGAYDIAFSPNGQFLAASGKTIRIWDMNRE